MPKSNSCSFRSQTTGGINDFLFDEQLECAKTQNILSYFAGTLLNYKEEGVEFLPSIVLCNSISDTLSAIPGFIHHEIGVGKLDVAAASKVLKECAPLSGANWYVYVERNEAAQTIKYGVFSFFQTPQAVPLDEAITLNESEFCVLIRKSGAETINIVGSKGNSLRLIFSTLRDAEENGGAISEFSDTCCSLSQSIDDDFQKYFRRLLEDRLTACHGTILACCDGEVSNLPPEMQDAVIISPPLDLPSIFSEYKTQKTADSILALQRCEDILGGFLNCDGIIVLDKLCRVVAYRVFFRPNSEPENIVVGGARRRAFEGLKSKVGNDLVSILFRSQDGTTIFYRGSDE